MKRILFYVMVLLQLVIIAGFAWQYDLIDRYGKPIKLVEETKYVQSGKELYVDYSINKIPENKWDMEEKIDYREKLFVLLEEGDQGIYHVKRASIEKMEPNSNQIVFPAHYEYHDTMTGEFHVTYGIEHIYNDGRYDHLQDKEKWEVTVLVAPWGQKKVVSIEHSG